jgi:hypothetical protein
MLFDQASDGSCEFSVSRPENGSPEIVEAQNRTVHLLFEKDLEMRDAILSLFDQHWASSSLWESYVFFSLQSEEEEIPEDPRSVLHEDFWLENVALLSIEVLPLISDGYAYTQFQFECSWEIEHGTSVVFLGTQPIAGGAGDMYGQSVARDHMTGNTLEFW